MANDDGQINVQPENEQQAVGLAQRAAQILHNLPLNLPVIPPNENRINLGHLDRDFHVLVHEANVVLAEQLAVLGELSAESSTPTVGFFRGFTISWNIFYWEQKYRWVNIFEEFNIHREANRADDEPIMGGMERIAVGLIDELRNMIEHLIRQRDEMRQLVMQRGLFDPLFGQWDELLEVWGVRNFTRENGKTRNPKSLETVVMDFLTNIINGIPVEAYALPLSLLFEIHTVRKRKAWNCMNVRSS
ncbi:unnamed protein product [Litomosoides sigmodontis]|uniref:Uncharacterized protein n=1 Tax=Litomosoides sigmodontis TaxID=42156 RepID=A0A3P6THL7_LITSI|nr:unnamed protein product [Litomosoides sigmodontis]